MDPQELDRMSQQTGDASYAMRAAQIRNQQMVQALQSQAQAARDLESERQALRDKVSTETRQAAAQHFQEVLAEQDRLNEEYRKAA